MIKNFTLKSYDNYATHDDIVRDIDNDAVIAEKALRPLAMKYALSLNSDCYKTGNTWELINPSFELDPYKPYLNIFNRPFKHDYLEKEHKWYIQEESFGQDIPSVKGPVDQSSPLCKYHRCCVYCLYSNWVQDILFANNLISGNECQRMFKLPYNCAHFTC